MTTHHRITRTAAVALALSAGAAPASALPMNLNAQGSLVPAGTPNSASGYSSAPTIVRVSPPNDGFDWVDAGIGAAGGFALSMLGIGGGLAISQRRARRTLTS